MDTIELLKQAMASPSDDLAKAFLESSSATSGLTYYDLEAPAKTLYPVLTPLRNAIARVSGKGGIQANWRAITGINTGKMSIGVSEGNRSGVITTSTEDYLAAYRGIGLEDYVTFEATYAGQGFDDVKARAVQGLLRSLMIGEEVILLGGNGSAVALGTTPTPTVSGSNTGGTLAAATYSVICVALTLEGYYSASIAGGVNGSVSRTSAGAVSNTDTYGGGSAQKSAAASSGSLTGTNTNSFTATVAPVTGAVAYAWYWGTSGNELLGAITTINSVSVTADATGTQNASALAAADHSKNALVFDGLLYQALKSGSNAYSHTMATGTAGTGSKLTANSVGGVDEIDTALQSFWDNYRLSPDEILVSSQEQKSITNAILSGSSTSAQRFSVVTEQSGLVGGFMVKEYLNPFSMGGAKAIPITIHPNMPAGTIMFITKQLPYPMSNVQNVMQVRARQEYYQLEWPLMQRKYEYGVYADEVLQHYFPPSLGVINNIAAG